MWALPTPMNFLQKGIILKYFNIIPFLMLRILILNVIEILNSFS